MGWRRDEEWFEVDVLWFREQPRLPVRCARAGVAAAPVVLLPAETGLEASRRRRRMEAQRREAPARDANGAGGCARPGVGLDAVVRGASASERCASASGLLRGGSPEPDVPLRLRGSRGVGGAGPARRSRGAEARVERCARSSRSSGTAPRRSVSRTPGRLVEGTQLPHEGADWVTWNPNTDSVPNLRHRLYGNERTIRAILSVVGGYRNAHPDAPRVVIGDLSLRDGGTMDQHVSHQNGLDVDVYYPRLDRYLSAPIATSQIDRALAQDLLDRFVSAGAQTVFVGYSTGLRGPSGVVVPYPNHENHMHVRFPTAGRLIRSSVTGAALGGLVLRLLAFSARVGSRSCSAYHCSKRPFVEEK